MQLFWTSLGIFWLFGLAGIEGLVAKERGERSPQNLAFQTKDPDMFDAKHGVKMGVAKKTCDDAKTNLDADWNGNPVNYTCYWPNRPIVPDTTLEHVEHCQDLPKSYYPRHYCMSDKLSYDESIPTHGDHRPLWPKFGEYRFVPPQRWLHNIEHGSVVMLYHPCAHIFMVNQLRKLVTGCLRKHIITASDRLTRERPLALVAWGCRLEMSYVDDEKAVAFIRSKALKGPEGDLPKQGHYDLDLLKLAEVLPGSDINDSVLCPQNP